MGSKIQNIVIANDIMTQKSRKYNFKYIAGI